jgi:integrase
LFIGFPVNILYFHTVINTFMKPGNPPLQSTRLLDQVRERIRYLHYSLSTEKLYVYWVRFFIRWHGLKHPRDMGAKEVEGFLTMLATERKVSASTHNQALSALLFLYREVLGISLPWLDNLNRPSRARRIPSVLTKNEVAGLFAALEGETALLARLLYGTGMRLMEGIGAHTAPQLRHPSPAVGQRHSHGSGTAGPL